MPLVTYALVGLTKRHARCYDTPSAFVNTDVDKNVLTVL